MGPTTEFEVDEAVEVVIYVVLRGPITSTLNLLCTELTIDVNNNDLCEIGTANLTRGNGNDIVKVSSNIFDDAFEELLWTFDGDWRVFQIKVYELID